MQIIPVNDTTTGKQFLQMAVELYKNDAHWIRPLDKDIDEVFEDRKSTRLNSSHSRRSRMPSSA